MKVVIRTDSSFQIGSGHVMRCLTLADELRQRGADILFVCREHPGNMIDLIEGRGHQLVRLAKAETNLIPTTEDVAHAEWLGVSWQQDVKEVSAVVENIAPDWLVIDHYALDRRWEKVLRPYIGKIMVIDDLADRSHDCDLLLDQNLYPKMETRYNNLLPDSCRKLLGPKYALLRPEFATARKNLRQRDGEVRRVLVFFGGVDSSNETEKTLHALLNIPDRRFEVDVVVGCGNPYKNQIQSFCAVHDGFKYYCQVENMSELMASADLAIGAGGSTTWERCALGIPSVITALADNQTELAETGAKKGFSIYLGKSTTNTTEKLLDALSFFLKFPLNLQLYSENNLAIVDARGTQRVASLLFPPQITIRRANTDDCDDIYDWRNAVETRRFIFDDELIPLDTHRSWYLKTIKNPDRVLLIGEIASKSVGVLRYDLSGNEALISVYLVPGGQGQGVGAQLIRCGSQWLKENYPKIKIINAEIFKENVASLRAFESAGYTEHHAIYKEVL